MAGGKHSWEANGKGKFAAHLNIDAEKYWIRSLESWVQEYVFSPLPQPPPQKKNPAGNLEPWLGIRICADTIDAYETID